MHPVRTQELRPGSFVLAFVALLLGLTCVRNEPLAVDQLVHVMLASALEILERTLELLSV